MKKQGLVLPILGLLLSIAGTVAVHFSTRKSYWWTLVLGGIFLFQAWLFAPLALKNAMG